MPLNPPPTNPYPESYIQQDGNGCTTLVGRDAVLLYSAMTVRSAIRLWLDARVQVNRQATPKSLLTSATRFTGKPYRRGQLAQAAADLDLWIETMKSALPVIRPEGRSPSPDTSQRT